MFSLRHTLMGGAAVCAVSIAATPALAEVQSFDIPAQPARTAIQEFGRQSGLQILASQTDVGDQKVQALKGEYEPREALRRLLIATNLRVASDDGRTVTLAPQSGSAAGDGADGTVQALIVTAQKREEDIQDVPIAISAFTQEDLTRSQVAGGPDLVTQVPNFTFTKTNFSSYSIQIRGIGTQAISATTDPAVAVAFNNTPFIRNRFFEQEFYDLQRVEVLRGPQGTLYGRNATAGVVNIISQKAKFTAESRLSADAGNFSSSRIEGMINIPLVEDKVALRLAGAWTKRDGYATNELTGNPIDGRDLWSTRLSLRISPNERLDANLIWEHFQEDDDRLRSGKQLCKKDVVTEIGGIEVGYDENLPNRGQGGLMSTANANYSQGCTRESLYSPDSFQTPMGRMLPYYVPLSSIGLPTALDDPYRNRAQSSDLRTIESTIDPDYRASSDIGELQVSYDLTDHLTLASETAFGRDFVYSLQDFNRFNTAAGAWTAARPYDRLGVLQPGPNGSIFCDPQLGCSDRLVAVDVATATATQFSQEFRLSSNWDGAFNFSLGANFLRADSKDKYYVFINSLSMQAALGNPFFQLYPYRNGVTDNVECMDNGYLQGDPNGVYPVTGCTYIDPNPIDALNDEGHNYFLSNNPYKLISYAVFGEAYYNFTPDLKLTAGLRWTVDKKRAPRVPTWLLASNSVGYPVAEVIQQEWNEPTGRLALDWKPHLSFTDETLLYASFAHGYKAGGANPPGFVRIFYSDPRVALSNSAASATRPKTFEPEFVNAFEVGTKNTLLAGRMTMNLAGFYYDYTGYQVSEIVDRSAFNRNFDATVWGLELESDWRPIENLRLGLKAGYERTRIADSEAAIDLMDRTAGDPNWLVVRPFPTYASSCILPLDVVVLNGQVTLPGSSPGGGPTGCEVAYIQGLDPVTQEPYTADPAGYGDYHGFDPLTAPNNGEGIKKPLGGNELPNAPHFTATVMGDYTVPLGSEWLMTVHTDVHWQSQSWWRVFNDHVYDKLHPYFTMNLAAIFTNEEQGWNIMAYIKNVTDETAITGAFLNSDDTGLTTNVFLTEPRLYGLRVTKNWTGAPVLGWLNMSHTGPYPLTVELGGQVQRHHAPNEVVEPVFGSAFGPSLDVLGQGEGSDLDWGDGREVKITYRPVGPWSVSAGVRFGKTNSGSNVKAIDYTDPVCIYSDPAACAALASDPKYGKFAAITRANNANALVFEHEQYTVADFAVGRDVGFGGLNRSTVSAGLRHADFSSLTKAELRGVPDWNIPAGFIEGGFFTPSITHTTYKGTTVADRGFEGFGPTLSWEAAWPLLNMNTGEVDLDWSASGGVLFGKQDVSVAGGGTAYYTAATPFQFIFPGQVVPPTPTITTLPAQSFRRSASVTVPNLEASLGFSYRVGGFAARAGYRWERYYNVIDGGFTSRVKEDRTIDGPYFKIAVGFGG